MLSKCSSLEVSLLSTNVHSCLSRTGEKSTQDFVARIYMRKLLPSSASLDYTQSFNRVIYSAVLTVHFFVEGEIDRVTLK